MQHAGIGTPVEGYEKLNDIDEVQGFKVINMAKIAKEYPQHFEESGQMNWKWFEKEIRPNHSIYYRPDKKSLTFNFGEGGVTVDAAVELLMEVASDSEYIPPKKGVVTVSTRRYNRGSGGPYKEREIEIVVKTLKEVLEKLKEAHREPTATMKAISRFILTME